MTYNVFGGTLSLAQSINQFCAKFCVPELPNSDITVYVLPENTVSINFRLHCAISVSDEASAGGNCGSVRIRT